MTNPPHSDEEVRKFFGRHVPEVVAGTVEIAAISREAGRLMVAVRSHDSSVHPVSACVGNNRIHPKNISRELGDEKMSIVLWSESTENFIRNALSPLLVTGLMLDAGKHQAQVEVKHENLLVSLKERHATLVRLVSRLVGWDIPLVSNDPK